MLQTFLRVLDRQGILKGDLNVTQRLGLMWLMNQEIKEDVAIERVRLENYALASNPNTSQVYLEHLFEKRNEDNEMEADLQNEGIDVEWQTPKSPEEVSDVLDALGLKV